MPKYIKKETFVSYSKMISKDPSDLLSRDNIHKKIKKRIFKKLEIVYIFLSIIRVSMDAILKYSN